MVLLGIHFPTFHKTREYLEAGDAPGTFTPWKILASGAAAGAAGSVVSSPTELIRTKMQMVRKNNILAQMKGAASSGLNPEENYKGNWDCAKKIFRNHGMRGMYSGYLSTLLRDMQGYAWFFFGYEATVHYLAGPGKTKADLHYSQVGGSGLTSAAGLGGGRWLELAPSCFAWANSLHSSSSCCGWQGL
jgi:solute carrier family 25 carnitine/acylcarnitine transporter 20/29